MSTVYLNGAYVPAEEARVSVEDRGFLFADGVYEVTPAYDGSFFRMGEHRARMERGLRALRIEWSMDGFEELHETLLRENGLEEREMAIVYLQVTRGCAPRTHAFPQPACEPTVYAYAKEFVRPDPEEWSRGSAAITVPDRRWSRVDLKTIALLPNVLAQQAAVDAGVEDALFVRDGIALEGSHNNLFAVFDGVVTTHPADHLILRGITRGYVLELAEHLGLVVAERPIPVEEIREADEVFFTGTTTEVRPTVRLDGEPVGSGEVGPVARRLQEALQKGVRKVGRPQALVAGGGE